LLFSFKKKVEKRFAYKIFDINLHRFSEQIKKEIIYCFIIYFKN